LDELVQHEKNGLVFDTSSELARQMMQLLASRGDPTGQLATMRQELNQFRTLGWERSWALHALPLFQ
jgi:beta-1,4-mannosyltransferase